MIKAKLIEVLPARTDTGACAISPCSASVQIVDIVSCGASVSLYFNAGDTLEMQFAYTLGDTRKTFPGMKEHYKGLKRGDVFTAVANQRMRPGTGEYFVIYGYKRE